MIILMQIHDPKTRREAGLPPLDRKLPPRPMSWTSRARVALASTMLSLATLQAQPESTSTRELHQPQPTAPERGYEPIPQKARPSVIPAPEPATLHQEPAPAKKSILLLPILPLPVPKQVMEVNYELT